MLPLSTLRYISKRSLTMNLTRRDAFSLGLLGTLALSSCRRRDPELERPAPPWEGGPRSEEALEGYIDRKGNWVIEPQFAWVYPFNGSGYAGVTYEQESKRYSGQVNRWSAIIDASGAPTCQPTPHSQFLTRQGDLIIRYDDSMHPDDTHSSTPEDYAEGDAKYGAVDPSGSWRSPDRYEDVNLAVGTYKGSCFLATRDGEGWGAADPKGGWLIDPLYHMLEYGNIRRIPGKLTYPLYFFEFNHSLPVRDRRAGLWGWLDEAGRWLIEPQYRWASCFNKAGIAAYEDDSGLYGLISQEGETVLKPSFADLYSIYASELFIAKGEEGGSYGIVDASGSWVVEPAYKEIEPQPVTENPAIAFQEADSELWGVAPSPESLGDYTARFESISFTTKDTMIPAKDPESHLEGYIDSRGEWVLEPIYRDVWDFAPNGLAPAQKAV